MTATESGAGRSPADEVFDLHGALVGDVFIIHEMLKAESDPTIRRVYVKAVFVLIEGHTHQMKQFALAEQRHPRYGRLKEPFSEGEVALLAECSRPRGSEGF